MSCDCLIWLSLRIMFSLVILSLAKWISVALSLSLRLIFLLSRRMAWARVASVIVPPVGCSLFISVSSSKQALSTTALLFLL